jgi:hypothetical protein
VTTRCIKGDTAYARLVRHHGLSVLLVTMSECGVLLVRRGHPEEPLPLRGEPLAVLEVSFVGE